MLKKSRKFRKLQKAGADFIMKKNDILEMERERKKSGKKKRTKHRPKVYGSTSKFIKNTAILLFAIKAMANAGVDAKTVSVSANGDYPETCSISNKSCRLFKVTDGGKLVDKVRSNWEVMATPEEKATMSWWDWIRNAMGEGPGDGPDPGLPGSVIYRHARANFPENPFPVATRWEPGLNGDSTTKGPTSAELWNGSWADKSYGLRRGEQEPDYMTAEEAGGINLPGLGRRKKSRKGKTQKKQKKQKKQTKGKSK